MTAFKSLFFSTNLYLNNLYRCSALFLSYKSNSFRVLFKNLIVRKMVTDYPPYLTLENMNPNVRLMEYAVRGPLLIRAEEIEKELQQGIKKPFSAVIRGNIGDCHAMGQIPITFIRQVLALCVYPPLFENKMFLDDAKQRAHEILQNCRGCSVGSYTDSPGIPIIRKHVAQYIEKRDCGISSDFQNIVLSNGASDGIKNILKLMNSEIDDKPPGVMIPIPQYPLYSATLAEFNIHQVKYFLDESKQWALNILELQRSLDKAREECINVRAVVVINPGNPTGQVLTRQNIEEIIKFAHKEHLFILADEVYQNNVYDPNSKFYSFKMVTDLVEGRRAYQLVRLARTRKNISAVSESVREEPSTSNSHRSIELGINHTTFRRIYPVDLYLHLYKVMTQMGSPYDKIELASFMSCSKGYMGECGLRGGYTEIVNMCPKVKAMLLKSISAMLCPTVIGQVCLDVIMNPPCEGESSYCQYIDEKQEILDSLKLRAKMVVDTLNSLEGYTCNTVQGAMYAFPQIKLPEKALEAAKAKNQPGDVFYAFQLLEETGVCIIPGTGFGQQPDTYHFRTTILPQLELLKVMLEKISTFHKEFLNKYK